MKAILVILLLVTTCNAQDKVFWGLAAGAHASTMFDVKTTVSALKRCPSCTEANPIMRPFTRQSASAYGVAIGLTTTSTAASYMLKERGVRWWWAPLVAQIGVHAVLGIRNSRVR